MSRPIEELLRENPFYRRLSSEERARLGSVTHTRFYGKGASIFREGDPADAFFSIAQGRAKVFKTSPSGKDLILHIFRSGDPLGAVAVYEGVPYPASAEALEDTTCLRIGRSELFALLQNHPALVRGLLLSMTHRLIELTQRMTELSGGRVEARFARLFLKLSAELGREHPDGVQVPMDLSRQDLADLVGTTIETSIRVMSRWGKDGLVRTEKQGFTVLNRTTLRALASD